jgi:hypothetical protein
MNCLLKTSSLCVNISLYTGCTKGQNYLQNGYTYYISNRICGIWILTFTVQNYDNIIYYVCI